MRYVDIDCVCLGVAYLFPVRYDRYDTIAEGIGNDHVTANFAKALIDDAFRVSDQEAVYMAHYLLRHEGESVVTNDFHFFHILLYCVYSICAIQRVWREYNGFARAVPTVAYSADDCCVDDHRHHVLVECLVSRGSPRNSVNTL